MNKNKVSRGVMVVATIGIACIISVCGKTTAYSESTEDANERTRSENEGKAEALQKASEAKEAAKEAARIAAMQKEDQESEKNEAIEKEKGKQAKAQQEKELAAYANKRFAEVSMEPTVMLSPRAKALNISYAFIGKDLQTYKKLLADKNWLGAMSVLDQNREKVEFDNKGYIDSAVSDLKTKQFQFLAKISPSSVPKKNRNDYLLCYIPIPDINDPDADWYGSTGSQYRDWEVHPDGIGVLHAWKPADREIMILVDNPSEDVYNANMKIDAQFRTGVEKLKKKQELGELDDAGFKVQLRELQTQERTAWLALLNKF